MIYLQPSTSDEIKASVRLPSKIYGIKTHLKNSQLQSIKHKGKQNRGLWKKKIKKVRRLFPILPMGANGGAVRS